MDIMDVANLSMNLSSSRVINDVQVAVLKKSLDTLETTGDDLTKMMEASVTPNLGQNIDIQYMRMAADKQLGRTHHDAPLYGRIVLAGIAPYVFHQHFRAVHRKTEHLRIELAQVLPVYIAIYRTKRPERRQLLRHFQCSYITGMPYFIARLKVLQVLLIPISMRIRQ